MSASIEPIETYTLRDKAVTRLKQMIVQGELVAGRKLTESFLADSLGISRAPLREALRELVDTKLLVSLPYKGIFVRSATREDLEEIYSLRLSLEKLAFEICWKNRTPDALGKLVLLNSALIKTVDEGVDADLAIRQELELHSWCYTLSGHRLLIDYWERLKPNLHFYFTYHQKAHNRAGPFREAHDEYVACACGDDLQVMLTHLESHMRQGLETTNEYIDSANAAKPENEGR